MRREFFWITFIFILLIISINFLIWPYFKRQRAELPRKTIVSHISQVTLRFVTISIKRNISGFQYIQSAFQSIKSIEKYLNFQYIAFSRSTEQIPIADRRFSQRKIAWKRPSNAFVPKTRRELGILHQTLDWIAMMKSLQNDCHPSEILVMMEDDFSLCPHSLWHLLALFEFAQTFQHKWAAIRASIGLSGIFIQCKDIPSLLKFVESRSIASPTPIDMVLPLWWNSLNGEVLRENRKLYTYRWTLFEHLGHETSVGHDNNPRRFPKCFSTMHMLIFPAIDYFDPWSCGHRSYSPCDIDDDIFQLSSFPEANSALSFSKRKSLMEKFGVTQVLGENKLQSCDMVCEKAHKACDSNAFPLINDCRILREVFGISECQSNAFGEHAADPSIVNSWYGSFQTNPVFTCNSTINLPYKGRRLCPCITKDGIPDS